MNPRHLKARRQAMQPPVRDRTSRAVCSWRDEATSTEHPATYLAPSLFTVALAIACALCRKQAWPGAFARAFQGGSFQVGAVHLQPPETVYGRPCGRFWRRRDEGHAGHRACGEDRPKASPSSCPSCSPLIYIGWIWRRKKPTPLLSFWCVSTDVYVESVTQINQREVVLF